MHRFINNFHCFCAANAAVSAAKWIATLHDFGNKWSRFWKILWNFVKSRHKVGEPKATKNITVANCFQTFCWFFSKFGKKCKLSTKYLNSYGISVVILQQSALCSQQNRLSFWAIWTKFCKFWIAFNRTLAKFYTSLLNSKLKWTRQTQIVFSKHLLFFFQIHKKKCKRFGNAPLHQQFPLFLCSERRCVRG